MTPLAYIYTRFLIIICKIHAFLFSSNIYRQRRKKCRKNASHWNFFLTELSSHDEDTINQSHILGTISRSMPALGSTVVSLSLSLLSLPLSLTFLDSSVATSTSATPTTHQTVVRFLDILVRVLIHAKSTVTSSSSNIWHVGFRQTCLVVELWNSVNFGISKSLNATFEM